MSAFYAFGSGALEQSLENKRAAAERKFELVKQIAPYALQNIDEQRKLLETEQKTKDTLSNVYTEQQQNVLYSLNPNLLYSTKPLEDAQALVQGFGADEVSAMEALNAAAESAEFDSGTQERLENYKDIYTNDIAGQLGLGQSTIDLQLGLRGGQQDAQEPAPDMQTVEGEAMPMEQPAATSPPMADLAFGGDAGGFSGSTADDIAQMDYKQSPITDNISYYNWLETPVDFRTGQQESQFTGDDFTPIPRKNYYILQQSIIDAGDPAGNQKAMTSDINLEMTGGTTEITPEIRDSIMDVVSSRDPEEAQRLINYFNTQTPPIPYAEEFPQLNTIAQGE